MAGFLQDQGVPQRIANDSEAALQSGHGVLAIKTPTGNLGEFEVRTMINQYGADTYGRVESNLVDAHFGPPDNF